MANNKSWDESQFRQYNLKLEQIPHLHYLDPKIDEFLTLSKPVVIKDSDIIKPAQQKWNLDYLEKNLGNGGYTVFVSKNHKFKFFDEKKLAKNGDFIPPTKKVEMKISDFMSKLKDFNDLNFDYERLYLQQSITLNVGHNIVEDFVRFNWRFLKERQNKHNWGPLTSNVLFIAMEGNVTPCHYDEQQNFFAQVLNHKRCILFSPDQFECLYPHPVHHPHDRQSMVDFDNPDYEQFPKFKDIKGYETVIGPGDVLYIPIYWWHHIESLLKGGPTVTINFWYKGGSINLEYPLKDHQKISIMRNVEKMLLEVLQDPKEVGSLLKTMVLGRYTN